VLQIILRINGQCFTEPFHRMLHIDLNLALYLAKFLRLTPQQALSRVKSNKYALLNKARNCVLDSDQVLKCRGIQSNDVLDIIKLKADLVGLDITPHIIKSEQVLVYNPYGGFRVELAEKYM
jgi:hypothetical protein